MNSRKRVLAAIRHEEPDRTPVDLGATPSSGISAIAYNNLRKHLCLPPRPARVYDVVQQLAEPDQDILDLFGVDVIDLGRAFNTNPAKWYDVSLADGATEQYPAWFHPHREGNGSWIALAPDDTPIAVMPNHGAFFDQTCFPYLDGYPENFQDLPQTMGKVLWAALAHSPWDHAAEETFWQDLRQKAIDLRKHSDRAILIVCGCNLFEWGTFLRRIDNFLMDLLTDQASVERLLDALLEIHLATLEKVCEAVGDVADIIRFGDDLGMDTGPFMAPSIYRQLFKPRHRQLCEYVKSHSGMHTFLHSCGGIADLIPDLIEAGYEILNPVQTNCRGMEPDRLKQDFGRDVTFWGGGADTRQILNRARPEKVRAHVLERLEIFTPGGGFVFNPVHNILPEVPPENIISMFDAVREFNQAGSDT
ncbi:methyltransferase [bacterium]|nr:methyltransferase [bacterium]